MDTPDNPLLEQLGTKNARRLLRAIREVNAGASCHSPLFVVRPYTQVHFAIDLRDLKKYNVPLVAFQILPYALKRRPHGITLLQYDVSVVHVSTSDHRLVDPTAEGQDPSPFSRDDIFLK